MNRSQSATDAGRKRAKPRVLRSYIVEHDVGFAPNPFHGVCTLAACKPSIRSASVEGDYVLGLGAKKRHLRGRITYVMRVGKIITFDEYWADPRFEAKKPAMNGSRMLRYGDNIYHRNPKTGQWIQEDSFHSNPSGVLAQDNLDTDTGRTDSVLLADWFIYWGGDGPMIPPELFSKMAKTQGHKNIKDKACIEEIVAWAKTVGPASGIGEPAEWRYLKC